MELPQLKAKKDNVNLIKQFLGLNRGYVIGDGEWSDMRNMTNDYYPIFTNRKKRGKISFLPSDASPTDPDFKVLGSCGGRYISFVIAYNDADGNRQVKLQYNSELICDLEGESERQLVMMGAILCVFPDGICYNTITGGDTYTITNEKRQTGVSVSLCKIDGTGYDFDNIVTGTTEPEDKTKYWMDTSQDTVVLKIYNTNSSIWVSVGTTYVMFKKEGSGFASGFKPYDAVTFTGVDTGHGYNGYDFNQSNIVYAAGDDYLVVTGLINEVWTNSTVIKFERKQPKLDYVCELNNRLWGCYSGYDDEGNYLNEVYSCKLGDPTNWYSFAGLDSDSYTASVGTQNVFTGIASYGGYMYFFKEDGYHKLYGTKPSNYEMVWKPCRGVQNGSSKSVCHVGEYLMWKANDSIILFDGSASNVGVNLGVDPLYNAVGGSFRNKYYVSMRDSEYNYLMYVYDISKNMWTIEDELKVNFSEYANEGLYIVDNDSNIMLINTESMYTALFPQETVIPRDELYCGYSSDGTLEDDYEWTFTTGDIDLGSPYHKYMKRFIVRLWLDISAKVKIEVMYDSDDEWQQVIEYYSTNKRSYEMPIVVKRCDHMQVRFSGWGNVKLFSFAKAVEEGSGTDGEV